MQFKDRLKEKRAAAHLTQAALASAAGVSKRTIQSYELGDRRPSNLEVVQKIAGTLGTTLEELLGTADTLEIEAHEIGGAKAARDIRALVGEVAGLFAGGQLDDDAMDGAMKALNDAYWLAKEKNKKYAPKKFREKTPSENGGADA